MSTTRAIIEYAVRNGGIVTVHEAAALGAASTTISRRIQDGIFVRVGRGVLALPGTATRSDLPLRIAQRTLGAVVSHLSAARIHGFRPIANGAPTVTVSHRGTHSLPGVIVHQATDLLEEHVEVIEGMRVTTPVRTLVDLAKVLARQRLLRVVEAALASGQVELEDLVALAASLSRRGKKGVKNLRSILHELDGTEAISETELEMLLLDVLNRAGLPTPVRQFGASWLRAINGRVDFAYLGERIVIEADSRRWHTLFDAFESDHSRDNAAQLEGWIVLRFTWRMIEDDPMSVVSTVRRALDARRVR